MPAALSGAEVLNSFLTGSSRGATKGKTKAEQYLRLLSSRTLRLLSLWILLLFVSAVCFTFPCNCKGFPRQHPSLCL